MTHPIAGVPPPPSAPAGPLRGLTREQTEAVTHSEGPLLLVAGPGAGKTRTLTHRIAHLLDSGQARPEEIVAVRFSVRAAGELRLRLSDLLGQDRACAVTAATFHSLCARLLRQHAPMFGRTERYTIYDQGDMRRTLEWILADRERAAVRVAIAQYGQPATAELQAALSRAKNQLLNPDGYLGSSSDPIAPVLAAVWRESEEELRRSDAVCFDDLLLFAVRLLREHPHRLRWIRHRWRWLVVDEFQDVNRAQAELVALLAGAGGNVAVVCDDDQVVHRFRGADPRHIASFAKRHPALRTIVLGHNFRSRAEILEAASRCVQHNRRRVAKQLIAVRGGGGQVHVRGFYEDWHEAHWVAERVGEAIAVTRAREAHDGDLVLSCARADLAGVRSSEARDRIRKFGEALLAVRREMQAGRSLGHVVLAIVMLDAGLVERYERRRDTSANAAARRDAERVLEDLRSLCRAARAFEEEHGSVISLRDFLEHAIGLHAQEIGAGQDRRVTISTIHRAKGSEAVLVFLLGCEEQLLPSWQSLGSSDPEALCEERRLFYVACTRAKDRLILTHVRTRGGRGTAGPSRFLAEAGLLHTQGRLAA